MKRKIEPLAHASEGENNAALIQLYVAEYQALTTRASYWIILQAGLMPVVPIYLALSIEVWRSNVITKEIVVWSTFAGLQVIALVWSQSLCEQFAAVRYIERYLRPLIRDRVHTDLFFGYEPYLTKHRPTNPDVWALSLPILGTLVFILITKHRYAELSAWDLLGAGLNVVLLFGMWGLTLKAIRIKREWSTSDVKIVNMFEELSKPSQKE